MPPVKRTKSQQRKNSCGHHKRCAKVMKMKAPKIPDQKKMAALLASFDKSARVAAQQSQGRRGRHGVDATLIKKAPASRKGKSMVADSAVTSKTKGIPTVASVPFLSRRKTRSSSAKESDVFSTPTTQVIMKITPPQKYRVVGCTSTTIMIHQFSIRSESTISIPEIRIKFHF